MLGVLWCLLFIDLCLQSQGLEESASCQAADGKVVALGLSEQLSLVQGQLGA